jgi:hypothetical protein
LNVAKKFVKAFPKLSLKSSNASTDEIVINITNPENEGGEDITIVGFGLADE